MKNIIILGGTGSIGTQSIDIINQREDNQLLGFSFNSNIKEAIKIIKNNKSVKYISTPSTNHDQIRKINSKIKFVTIEELSAINCYLVIVATVGFSALKPTINAIENGNDIALANKECIVASGSILFKKIKENKVNYYIIDSEHNAIEQCLNGENREKIKNIILTASGGPFLNKSIKEIEKVNIDDVINHPNWNMGIKISIDSANLTNKILEVIEAKYLFNVSIKNIKIVIHPTSFVHSMVEYIDNSIIMQMSKPSMRLPISYAMEKNNRKKIENYQSVDFNELSKLEFLSVSNDKYPIIDVLDLFDDDRQDLFIRFNALNEYFNYLFRQSKISFIQISKNILDNINFDKIDINSIDDVFNYHYQVIKEMENKYEYDFSAS